MLSTQIGEHNPEIPIYNGDEIGNCLKDTPEELF